LRRGNVRRGDVGWTGVHRLSPIVVLGRWKPIGVGLAALLFAATTSLQYLAQAMGFDVPYQLVLALPYVLTLAALAGIGGRATPPATLARIE
jgi:simple sugar transport system permease protein